MISNAINTFRKHLGRARAEEQGVGKSFARLIKNLRDTSITYERKKITTGKRTRLEPAQPIAGAYVKMLDKKPYQFWTDGSLRHVLPGMKPGKALRKALKRIRQRNAESARRGFPVTH